MSNEIANFEGFFISYNPNPGGAFGVSAFGSDTGGPETALVVADPNALSGRIYLILNGDFRKEYEIALAKDPSLGAARAVFLKNREHESSWSNTFGEVT